MNRRFIKVLVITLFLVSLGITSTMGQAARPAITEAQSPSPATNSRERFDFLVRADFFAGFAGDQTAFERAMKVCNDTLAKNPNHSEALVWRGSGLVFLAGQAFQKELTVARDRVRALRVRLGF